MNLLLLLWCLLSPHVFLCNGFVEPTFARRDARRFVMTTTTMQSLSAFQDADDGTWKLPNDFSLFLNQVAVQSFLFVLGGTMRDPHTVRWIDAFTQPVFEHNGHNNDIQNRPKSTRLTGTTAATRGITSDPNIAHPNGPAATRLLIFHGLACMNTTKFPSWHAYFAQLLQQPVESYRIQSHNGLAREYDMDINPPSLCARILSVREQIAREMAHDLGILANQMGRHTLDSYWDYMDDSNHQGNNDDENESDDNNDKKEWNIQSSGNRHTTTIATNTIAETTMSSGSDVQRRLPPHNLAFLDYSVDWSGDMAMSPSPLRKGNFDLVVLMATQESIHRLLNGEQHQDLMKSGNQQTVYQAYLRDFYTQRIDLYFTGIQRYGRADDFLEELLFSSESEASMVDPVRLTEMLLNERRQVALEWQAMSQDVPNDHIDIKRLQLNKLMESYSQ